MYSRILVPLDGSKFAEGALEHVRVISQCGTVDRIILLRVLEPLIADVHDYIGAEHAREAEKKLEADARKYINSVTARLKKEGLPAEGKMILNVEPAEKILEIATEEEVDLIIMSTHGRSAIFHWVFGSVAHKVLANSVIPVLVIPRLNRKSLRQE
jgi:nucleotide-binding universal stress UspA family protein